MKGKTRRRPSEGGRARSFWVVAGVSILVLAAAAIVFAGCGTGGQVGDAGTVSTTEGTGTTVTVPTQESTSTTSSSTTTSQAEGTSSSSTTSTTAATGKETMKVKVYYSRDEKMTALSRVLPKSTSVGAAAIKALLEGPTAAEKQAGIVSNIPEGTTFLGLDIKNGIATVDLSQEYSSGGGSLSMAMRLAEVVFTLTQFPSVKGVEFKLDGEPVEVFGGEGIILDHAVDRSDYEELSPAILVESPSFGETVSSPVRITGTANVFEAVFQLNITDGDGLIVADQTVHASSGTGTRGTFDVTVPFQAQKAGQGEIIVFDLSPKDGSRENIVEIPVKIVK